ncbi:hypothetical protein IMSAGC012_03061 [Lachnospiraceae bacterium]|uniref:Uncharacterized protein n=1 Tax=Petralouisia muris TaxID=3032872 RepID=A0AC61RTB8_9FIRM|nr:MULTISPECIES: hypothetical protein [Bacillota]EOS73285.1 hypothetical protein C819_04010 [Lachnospiraceae bacterium 10-1]TGY92697.1 hypothetical protein E5329_18945 [Petralouisia muris]GFI27932.1 hypothetical protein IMSAGC012_03061 [Lachnospiraceae bacterium]
MRKKMLKAAGVLCLSVVLCMGMAGCAGKENEQPEPSDVHMTNESGYNEEIAADGKNSSNEAEGGQEDMNNTDAKNSGEIADNHEEGVFYDGANLSGRVVDFSDAGCTITPRTLIINEDGSMEGGIAAPGYESEETNIHITYADDVIFQVIYFSMGSQTEISREDTDKNSIKKETDVNIFGTSQDDKQWIADKVVIIRWQ